MKLKQKKFTPWKPKTRSTLRDRKRRKQYKLHTNKYDKPIDYLNQHLDLHDFKKFRCRKDYKHNHLTCFYHHNRDDYIRDTKEINYCPKKCKKKCQDRNCSYAHNDFEKWFHPMMYKKVFCKSLFQSKEKVNIGEGTITCKNEVKCALKDFCPFAHNEEEIRTELFYNYEIDDDFMMFKYKTEPCPLVCVDHDHSKCLYSHGKKDHRRMVVFFSYKPKLCKNINWNKFEKIDELKTTLQKLVKLENVFDDEMIKIFFDNIKLIENQNISNINNKCKKCIECTSCHNVIEFLFHPSIYKAVNCEPETPENKCENSNQLNKFIGDDLNLFKDSYNNKDYQEHKITPENDIKVKCSKKHCSHSHESKDYETIQESTDPPFYKFAYNRITPGTFFPGTSFFSNRSENLVYTEDRLYSSQNIQYPFHSSNMNNMYQSSQGYNTPHMDPQKMYFKSDQNCWQNGINSSKENKENINYNNLMGPVNMNMYRIQMNNTFLMSNQQAGMGYIDPRMQYMAQSNQKMGFGQGMGGFGGYQMQNGNSGFNPNFYRC